MNRYVGHAEVLKRRKYVCKQDKAFFFSFLFFVTLRPTADHGLLILEVSRSHTTTHHSRQDSSGHVISSSQRPLSDSTQHSQQTHIHAPVGFEPTISAGERLQTYALDRAVTGIGRLRLYRTIYREQYGKIYYIHLAQIKRLININLCLNLKF